MQRYSVTRTDDYLEHALKGVEWKKHKYIKKIGDRYIYKEPAKDTKKKEEVSISTSSKNIEKKDPVDKKPTMTLQDKTKQTKEAKKEVSTSESKLDASNLERKELLKKRDSILELRKTASEMLANEEKKLSDAKKKGNRNAWNEANKSIAAIKDSIKRLDSELSDLSKQLDDNYKKGNDNLKNYNEAKSKVEELKDTKVSLIDTVKQTAKDLVDALSPSVTWSFSDVDLGPMEPETSPESEKPATKYTNKMSDEEAFENFKTGVENGTWETDLPIDTFEDFYKEAKKLIPKGTSFSEFMVNEGLIDETQDGYHPESYSDLKQQDRDYSNDEDQALVNHERYDNGYAYQNNCAYCTLTYEMRQRGYDVEASAISLSTGNTLEVIESWYEGDKKFVEAKGQPPKAKDIKNSILKNNPEGARGQFCVFWKYGGGHSMVYEVGPGQKVTIRDCQTNETYDLDNWPYIDYISGAYTLRTDNKQLTDAALVGVKNRED